jgi:hypothetical protein
VAGFPDTVYGQHTTQTRLQSDTADNVLWERYASRPAAGTGTSLAAALARVEFAELATAQPLRAVVQQVQAASLASGPGARVLVLAGRSRRLAVESHARELKELAGAHAVGPEVRKTLGDVASALVGAGAGAGVLVVQAAGAGAAR